MGIKDSFGIAAFGVISCGTFGLGTWQMQRYYWKLDLVGKRQESVKLDPIPFKNSSFATYERVSCKGDFFPNESITLGPRSPPSAVSGNAPSPSGFILLTPFTDKSTGKRILVNRGWMPRTKAEMAKQPFGEKYDKNVAIEGFIAKNECPGQFTPPNDIDKKTFYYLDSETMNKVAGVDAGMPIVEQLGSFPGGPETKTLSSLLEFKVPPVTHLGYAATWYGLCASSLYLIKRRFL